MSELRDKARYTGGFHNKSYTVKLFWDALHAFDQVREMLIGCFYGVNRLLWDAYSCIRLGERNDEMRGRENEERK